MAHVRVRVAAPCRHVGVPTCSVRLAVDVMLCVLM